MNLTSNEIIESNLLSFIRKQIVTYELLQYGGYGVFRLFDWGKVEFLKQFKNNLCAIVGKKECDNIENEMHYECDKMQFIAHAYRTQFACEAIALHNAIHLLHRTQ